MTNRYYIYIVALLVLLFGGTFFLNKIYSNLESQKKVEKYFLENINTNNNIDLIKKVEISYKGNVFTIVKQENNVNNWVILEKYKYPVNPQKLKELIFDLANLKILEEKTTKSENFNKLQLEDIDINPDSKAVRIILLDANNQEIDSIYIGSREFVADTNNYGSNIFVRKTKESKAWLVSGKLFEDFTFKNLVSQPIINLKAVDIKNIELVKTKKINGKNSNIKIARDADTKILTLLDIPNKYQLKDQYLLNNLVQQFNYLEYEDVVINSDEAEALLNGYITDTDNNKTNFSIVYLNQQYYFKLDNADWLYKISDYALQSILINKTDLIAPITNINSANK